MSTSSNSTKSLSVEEFLATTKFDDLACVSGSELQKLYWKFKGLEKEVARQKSFWASTNDSLAEAYRQLEARRAELAAAKKAIQTILDNLDQGFMAIDDKGQIQEGISKAAFDFFGPALEGKPLAEVLKLAGDHSATLKDWIDALFSQALPFNDLKAIGPKSFEAQGPSPQARYIELDFRPIRDEKKALEKVIVIGTDKTRERELKKLSDAEIAKGKMFVRIINDRNSFLQFLKDTKRNLFELGNNLDLDNLFRQIHTLKGNAATYHVISMKEAAHAAEGRLAVLRESASSQSNAATLVRHEIGLLNSTFEAFLEEHKKVLSTLGDLDATRGRERTFEVSKLSKMANLFECELGSESPLVKQFYDEFVLEPISSCFERFRSTVSDTAEQQSKDVKFLIHESPIKVYAEAYQAFFDSMVHAFRNAVDHGIKQRGVVEVRFEELVAESGTPRVRITVADDGQGIDPKVIGALAVERGLIAKEALGQKLDTEILQFVFAKGLTSKANATDLSGRGVGLDAVLHEANELQGQARVESTLGKGTRLIVELPLLKLIGVRM